MLSLSNASSIIIPQNDSPNPDLSQISFLSNPSIDNQQLSQSYSQMQTPNFFDLQNHFEDQELVDALTGPINNKDTLVNKLILTFESLGLDVEYLDQSETQDEHHSSGQSSVEVEMVKGDGRVDSSLKQSFAPDSKVLTIKTPFSKETLVQKLNLMKEYCQFLRQELSSMISYQKKVSIESQKIMQNTVSAFQTSLNHLKRTKSISLSKGLQECGLESEQQVLRKGYDQLSSIIQQKQQRINALIMQNNHLNLENQMLHFQLERLSKQLEKCKDVKEEHQIMLKTQHYYSQKNSMLQEENHELNKKIESLQYSLKEANKNLSQINEESLHLKEQLEQRYRKVFEQTVQKLQKKIEAQTYYKMKHDYHFNIENRQIKGDIASRSKNSCYSPIETSDSSGQQVASNGLNPTFKNSLFLRLESKLHASSKLMGTDVDDNERQLEQILNDIKKVNQSTAPNSLVSSQWKEFRRQSYSRPKYSRH